MEKTENFALNKPEAADLMRLDDFNQNSDIIDAALGNLNASVTDLSAERIYIGSYVGNGKSNRTVQLPWEPKFAVLMGHYSSTGQLHLLTQENDIMDSGTQWYSYTNSSTQLVGDTFVLKQAESSNMNGTTVPYILFR